MNSNNDLAPESPHERIPLDRLVSISDAIIAFAMTLLVLNVDIPRDHNFSEQGLFSFLFGLEHDLVVYAASFLLIVAYWVEHQQIFHYVRYINRNLNWLTFAFLFFVTMVPFGTKLKGLYRSDAIVVALFGAIHIMCWLLLILIWRFLSKKPQLLKSPIPAMAHSAMLRRLMAGPLVILIAIGVSFINVRLGTLLFLSVPICVVFVNK